MGIGFPSGAFRSAVTGHRRREVAPLRKREVVGRKRGVLAQSPLPFVRDLHVASRGFEPRGQGRDDAKLGGVDGERARESVGDRFCGELQQGVSSLGTPSCGCGQLTRTGACPCHIGRTVFQASLDPGSSNHNPAESQANQSPAFYLSESATRFYPNRSLGRAPHPSHRT